MERNDLMRARHILSDIDDLEKIDAEMKEENMSVWYFSTSSYQTPEPLFFDFPLILREKFAAAVRQSIAELEAELKSI